MYFWKCRLSVFHERELYGLVTIAKPRYYGVIAPPKTLKKVTNSTETYCSLCFEKLLPVLTTLKNKFLKLKL